MKNISLIFILIFGIETVMAQKPIFVKSEVSEIQLYKDAAEMYGIAEVNLQKGNSEIVIYNVAETMNEKTLQIGVDRKGISVLSSQFTKNYTSDYKLDTTHPRIKEFNDSIKIVEKLISDTDIEIQSILKTIELLDKNQTVLVGSNTSNVAQLKELANYYKTERTKLNQDLKKVQKTNADLTDKLSQLQNSLQVNSDLKEQNSKGVLVLKVSAESPGNAKFNISYLAGNVNWSPLYEIKGEGLDRPLDIILKAKVTQKTGVDWRNVRLSLIDGNSGKSNNAPVINPWFLTVKTEKSVDKMLEGRVSGVKVKEAPSQMQGAYTTVPSYEITENQLNTTYETGIPYDILANGQPYFVNLKQTKVPAAYNYYTVPAMSPNAYLVAKISDFNQYQLTSAPATVIFENTFVGETQLNPNTEEDELILTLGNDRKVSIKKEKIEHLNTKKTLSSKQEQTVTYDLVIRNNKTKSIEIEVKDRYPLTQNSDVKVDLLESSGAKLDKEKGFMTWNLKVNPNETKKIRVSYKVQFPKDVEIQGLN